MAGFSNAKPEKEVDGQRPLTRIIQAVSHVCQVMSDWLQDKRVEFQEARKKDEQRVYERITLEQSGDAIKAFKSAWRNHYSLAVSKGWELDFSVIDYRAAKDMWGDGWDEGSIAEAMFHASPKLSECHHDMDGYIKRTVSKVILVEQTNNPQ